MEDRAKTSRTTKISKIMSKCREEICVLGGGGGFTPHKFMLTQFSLLHRYTEPE